MIKTAGSDVIYDVFPAMGTHLEAVFPETKKHDAGALLNKIRHEVNRIEKKLSRFYPKSMVSRINQEAHTGPVRLDVELWDLLCLCQTYNRKTSGAFDITMRLPDTRVQASLKHRGMRYMLLNPADRTVRLQQDMEIDLGGVGKGYALAQVKKIVRAGGIANALINFGNSSILALGNHPHGQGWKIGLKSPVKEEKMIFDVTLNSESLSTSGTARRHGIRNSRRLSHLVNPRTGRPVEGRASFSVITESPLEGDILSTAFLIMSRKEKQNLFSQTRGIRGVEIYQSDDNRSEIREWQGALPPS
jgi:thiamine biosynthesis lipoprotein